MISFNDTISNCIYTNGIKSYVDIPHNTMQFGEAIAYTRCDKNRWLKNQ